MLKSIFTQTIILIILCSAFNLQAQNYFGARAGVNFATVSTTKEGSITNDLILGGNGVIYFDFNVGKKRRMGIQPEFAFIQKGYIRELPYLVNERQNIVYRLNYFDFSLLIKYKFGEKKGIRAYATFGPYIGKTFSGKTIYREDREKNKKADMDRFVKTNLGLVIGGGIVIPVRSVKFIMDLRYSFGLTGINDHSFDSGTLRNRGINLSVGYAFPLGARYYRP